MSGAVARGQEDQKERQSRQHEADPEEQAPDKGLGE